jgi:hypothetical protein
MTDDQRADMLPRVRALVGTGETPAEPAVHLVVGLIARVE